MRRPKTKKEMQLWIKELERILKELAKDYSRQKALYTGEKESPARILKLYGVVFENPSKKKTRSPSKKKPAKRAKKQAQIPPPFKRLTDGKINKLKGLFRVHPEAVTNPDPGDCPKCGMAYDDLKTGLDFQAVKDMLWIQDSNPEYWRHKRRGSVLGLWNEIKRGMWADHLEMCGGKQLTEKEYLEHLEQFDEY